MAGATKHVQIDDDDDFEDDLANFLGENYSTEEEEADEDEEHHDIPLTPEGDAATFWKDPDIPEKYPLDHVNVENLVNMLSKIHLVWPEDLPNYDEVGYAMDPEREKFPPQFYQNTDKEKVVLWHAENFRRQYLAKFMERRPLVVAPRNECGCQKMFSTYICPTAVGYPEFLDCVTTVEFLKDFFTPEIMNPPTKFPDKIRSHVTVIKKRNANAFEMAVITVSILTGTGYDAYVVDGFASKTLCTIDTTEDYVEPPEKPLLDYEIEEEKAAEEKDFGAAIDYGYLVEREEKEEVVTVSPSKYRFRRKIASQTDAVEGAPHAVDDGLGMAGSDSNMGLAQDLGGSIDDGQADELADTHEETDVDKAAPEITIGGDDDEEDDEEEHEDMEVFDELPPHVKKDRYHGKRTHAWILVLPGKRDVQEPFFLEPFSGTYRPIKDPNFLSIEAVFNHSNYWINVQPPVRNLKLLNYDLEDSSAWSKFLTESDRKRKKKAETAANLFQDDDEEEVTVKPGDLYLTMPVSWTTELDISQEDYDRKYPDGSKIIEYNDAVVEVAAPYAHPEGIVRKVMKFNGPSRDPEDLLYIEEIFEHRKDRLQRRKWVKDGNMVYEYFNKGRPDALKEHVHLSGKNKPEHPRDLYYYSNAHPRKVAHRQIIKNGLIEHFDDREDHLYYKLTLFGEFLCKTSRQGRPGEAQKNSKAKQFAEMAADSGIKVRPRRKVSKIVQKFHRFEDKIFREDIAEKHMLIEEGRLRILFHYEYGSLTRNTLEFFKATIPGETEYVPVEFKPEDCIEYKANRLAPAMDVYKKFNLLQQMDKDERAASIMSREAQDEVYQTVTARVLQDVKHEVEPDAYAGDKSDEFVKMMKEQQSSDVNEEEVDLSGTDFTTPFFEKYGVPKGKRDEILIKKRIMLHEKVKILRRAYMIKELYDREAATLREKQEWYTRNVDQMNPTQEEDFNHMYKERLFQMHILEQRMTRHMQETPRQYYELLVQLLRHPQLNRFTNRKVPPPPPPARDLTEEEKARIARELAKLKDCCQFYNIRFSEKKGKKKQAQQESTLVEAGCCLKQGDRTSTTPHSGVDQMSEQVVHRHEEPAIQGETDVAMF